jgi:hypothetical protein
MKNGYALAAFVFLFSARAIAAPGGDLTYDVTDRATHEHVPCKLTFVGVKGTPSPQFTFNDIGRQEGGAIAAWDRLMSLTGQGSIRLTPGHYDVWVSRGPEWTAYVVRDLVLGAPKNPDAKIAVTIDHVIDTRGWLSGDFHVHAAASPDSQVPMQDRIYEFVADGVELIVSTDHNVVADYAPIIQQLGAGRYLSSLPGDELTTNGWGHFGAFPLERDLERAGQGAVLVHGRSAKDFFADVRRVAPLAIIDVHHPRIDDEIGYFNLTHFNAANDSAERPGFSFDFDALEVLNGYQDAERKHVDKIIDDWFALLDHGHLVTATGNSDTHHLDHNIGGYPRNYFASKSEDPAQLTPEIVAGAVRGHHSFLTTAPFVRLTVQGATYGDLVRVGSGQKHVTAHIEVQAAPWVTVSSVTVYLGGHEIMRIPVAPSTDTTRLAQNFDVPIDRDDYLVVRVDGDKPMAPIIGDLTRFDVRPFALTNPIFFDVDGNGKFDPPQKRK